MSLRSKLATAFVLMAVVPLALVSLATYRASVRAFRQAVEAEATQLAGDMGQRMEAVTSEIGRRVERVWDAPDAAEPSTGGIGEGVAARIPAGLAEALGETALLLERVEVVPAGPAANGTTREHRAFVLRKRGEPPPPPAPKLGQGAPAAPLPPPPPLPSSKAAGSPAPPAGAEPAIVDLTKAMEELKREIAGSDGDPQRAAAAAWVDVVGQQVVTGLDVGRRTAAAGLRLGAEELARQAERHRSTAERKRALMQRGEIDVSVERAGRVVGTVNARVDVERMLGTVLALSQREQGEVPFAIDAQRRVYTARDADRATLERIGVTTAAAAGVLPEVRSDDEWIVVTRTDASGVVFGLARPVAASLEEIRRTSVRNLALGLALVGFALIGVVPVSRRMTRDLAVLTDGANQLARGDLTVRVPVNSTDEFGHLARSFNQMAAGLESHQKLVVEQERLHRELELCRRIQTEMLPRAPLRLGLAEIKGISVPAREVGGDFFNYFVLPNGSLALVVGDVSGKGVSAALLMANIQATLRARMPLENDLARLLDNIDREVDENTPGGVYVTLFVGILDTERRTLRYINAGHNPQFVLRSGGSIERLSSAGLPVGLYPGRGYVESELVLDDADLLFFYTDGMVEAENEQGDMFGIDRLEALLLAEHQAGVDDLLDRLDRTVREFRGAAEPFDDATMMALRLDRGPAVVS
jgi:serine phosphatase RsbU (regulator of sigma subunit)